jgi:glycosyltransferase involved in cell wall biosynthesis
MINEYIEINTKKKVIFLTRKKLVYLKYIFYLNIILFFLIINFRARNHLSLKSYKYYVNKCQKLHIFNRVKIREKNPYLSICLSSLNMKDYIEANLLSIINQSFQNFEIIIVNDNSQDNTESIIKKMQKKDDRILIINHQENLGVYRSRVEAILNAKGNFIILMDPDDMFLNENLFKELYNYNLKYNLDIIEFTVYQFFEGTKYIFYPNNHFETHFHNFPKTIIKQPELSNLLYYVPGTYEYSHTICRNIWNKMINKKLFLDMHKYIGDYYYNKFIITADDMFMNIIIYQLAFNYSNVKLPGYLYNIRKASMSRGEIGINIKKIRIINHFYYFNIFYEYIKEFHKDRNYLFYEMKNLKHYILFIKDYNLTEYIPKQIKFMEKIKKDKYTPYGFKLFLDELLSYFKNNEKIITIEY